MTTINAVGTSLSGQTGTGAFAGSVSPTLTTPIIARINDASGNAQLNFTSEPSAVNYVNIYNTSTGNGLAINALGADTNINLALAAKGAGIMALNSQALTNQYTFTSGTSFVHVSQFNFPVTALTRTYTWPDADGTVALASSPLSGYVLLSPSGNQTITDHDLYLSLGSFHSGSPAGGVNGNFTAYPTTANSGFIEIIANTNSSGNFGVVILPIGSIAQTQTLSIPDAGQASSTFILSTSGSGQTIGGGLTVNGGLTLGTPLAPTNGGTGTATAPSAGQIPIGNNGGTYTPAAINSGTNITVANGSASITVNLSGVISPTLGGTGVNNGSNTLTLAGTLATSGAFASVFTMTGATNVTFPTSGTLATTAGTVSSVSGTLNRITSTGGTTPVIDISASYVGQSSITTLGTITTGVWQGTLVSPIYGGTGVNNGSNTLTLAGTLATSGAFASTFTMTGATSVTFPTSGTLATTAQLAGAVLLAPSGNQTITSNDLYLSLGSFHSGSSSGGVNGNFTAYPTTAASGFIEVIANTNSSGNFGVVIIPTGAIAQTQTLEIPDAGSTTASFILSKGATQTITSTLGITGTTNITGTFNVFSNTIQFGRNGIGGTPRFIMYAPTLNAGFLEINPANNAGNYRLQITNASFGQATVMTIPDPGAATAKFIMSSGAGQTIGNGLTLTTPVIGAASATSVAFTSTSGIIGTTTNDNAAAGSVGEEVESVITLASGGVSLTNAASANVTSISLTAGDWDVWGNVGFSGNGTTTVVYTYGWISSTSATTPDAAYQTQWAQAAGTAIFAAANLGFPVPGRRFSLSGTTTIYLSVNSQFAVSTEFAFGGIYARRRR